MDAIEETASSTLLKVHNVDEYKGEKYSLRTRAIIIVIGSLLSWGIVLLPFIAFGNEAVLIGTEFGAEYLPRFQKWNDVMRRYRTEKADTGRPCAGGGEGNCAGPAWRAFLDKVDTDAISEQLTKVNRYVNKTPYMLDAVNWGESDHWAAPGDFFAKGGDCEDYAIAKYFLLRELGVQPERLRIVVLQDRRHRRAHAVLAVTWEDRTLVLDNLHNRIVPWRDLRHYLAIYSINERSAWLHARAESPFKQQPGG